MSSNFSFVINNLCVDFQCKSRPDLLLDSCVIRIEPGDKILILGESGSGKTVFLKTIAGLLPNKTVTSFDGSFTFSDRRTIFQSYTDYCNKIKGLLGKHAGMIHQDAINRLHPFRSIYQQQKECCPKNMKNIQKAIIQSFIDVNLIKLLNPDMEDKTDKQLAQFLKHISASELSGGMCQRFAIAMILFQNPTLILADEPLSDLDVSSRKTIKKLILQNIMSDQKKTALFATHDPDIIHNNTIFNKINYIENGKIHLDDQTTKNTLKKWKQNKIFLDANQNNENSTSKRILYANACIQYRYPGSKTLAVDMCPQKYIFQLHNGEHTGIVGETGSGKSTLARIISFLIRADVPDIFLMTAPETYHPLKKLNNTQYKNIQVVFQDSMGSLNHNETIEDSIKRMLDNRKIFYLKKQKRAVSNHFKLIGLDYEKLRGARPKELSMGMLRRYSLIRAWMGLQWKQANPNMPKILILDELTRGLDPINRQLVNNYLNRMKNFGVTYVLISHDLDFVNALCNRIMVMYQGWIVEERRLSINQNTFSSNGWHHPYAIQLWNKKEINIQRPATKTYDACKFFRYCDRANNQKCIHIKNLSLVNYSGGQYFCIQ